MKRKSSDTKKPTKRRKEKEVAPWLHIELGKKGITVGRDTTLKHRPFKEALKHVRV